MSSCLFIKKTCAKFQLYKRYSVELAHKIHGSPEMNSPVIVLHGLFGSKKNWESMSKKLAKSTGRSVIAADLRNHGESPHIDSHTYVELASDVSLLLTKFSLSKADIIGHSMGGRTAMVLALTEPAKVKSLVIVDISPVNTPGLDNKFFPKLIAVMKTINFAGVDSVAKARSIAKDKLISSGVIAAEGVHFILMNIGTRPDKNIGWNINIKVIEQNFTNIGSFPKLELAGKMYNGPVLFIGGDQSNYLPPGDIDSIKQYFPRAELKFIKHVGHNVHAEDPVTFHSMVKKFLDKD